MENILIKIKNLEKSYGKTQILKKINLNIYKNETVAILGANGAGKTTLIEIICKTKKATSGSVEYFFDKGGVKENIGVQFQEGVWPAGVTPKDILKFFQGIYNVSDERIEKLEEVFELKDFIKRPLAKISGGQKQRFNALLAVVHNPNLILLDEVTTGLDIQLQYKILNYIKKEICDGKHTLLLVSHGPEEIEKLVDRILIIDEGKIFIDIKTKDVISKYKSVRNMLDKFFAKELEGNVV
ncbi:ABC transporter ATP-binding protein [Spiroplasma endosymbiont of Amphibalanus improvisus]|uniref:ABC transporter ATP-binding protein n=1 Tax=Spiroplasma endosymbiont of Amphibalanus improvisus TaxID=3066327 RepID=UPI00313AC5E7